MKHYKYLLVLVAIVLASCSRFDVEDRVFENSAYLNVSATDQTQLATFNNRIDETSVSLAVQLAYPADKDISATVSVDASLVDEYNHRHSTAYEMLPSQYFDFPGKTVSVTAGRVSSEKVEIRFRSRVAYMFAERYGAEGYLESSSFSSRHDHETFIAHIKKCVTENRQSVVVKHHEEKYGGHYPL